jgi:hypothetical protein
MRKINLTEDVLVQIIDEQAVIVSPSGGIITTVNETGAFILQFLKNNNNTSTERIVEALQDEFDAPKDIIEHDVVSFIDIMLTNKIVSKI